MSDRPLGFWAVAEADPQRVAVIDAEGGVTTFRALQERATQIARGLRRLGLARGDGIALMLPNTTRFVEVYLAGLQVGLYVTTLNWHLTAPELAHILDDCEANVLVADARFGPAIAKAAEFVGLDAPWCLSVGTIDGFQPLEEFGAEEDPAPLTDPAPGSHLLYTSGTTGRPKGVHRPLPTADLSQWAASQGVLVRRAIGDQEHGAHLVTGPLYHAAPLVYAAGALHLGHALVLMDGWSAEATLDLIERHRVTSSHLVPTMFHRLLGLPEDRRRAFDPSSLERVVHGAAPCPAEVKRRMLDWWGHVIYEYYAATEGGGTFVTPQEWLAKPGTVGRANAGTTVKVVDDEGRECAIGEVGTVYMGNPANVFSYFKDDVKTNASRRGDLHTLGDIGHLDGDGYLFLRDRLADLIISGGVNIYPAEVEATLLGHPAVADVAVVGVPDREWGESVLAIVQVHDATHVRPGPELVLDLLGFCQSRLARFKQPRAIEFREALPRLPTGKLAKHILRDEIRRRTGSFEPAWSDAETADGPATAWNGD